MEFAFLRILLAPATASAQLVVDIGTRLNIGQLLSNIVNFLAASIGFVTVAIFIFGALKLTASGAHEDWRQQGKDLMIGSLIGMALVLGAYAILRTVMFFLVA